MGKGSIFNMARTALVTGGAGFIGSHLSEALLRAGWKVRIYDNLSTGVAGNVPSGAELVEADILSIEDLRQAASGVNTVFHLAASVSVQYSVENPEDSIAVNATGTLNTLAAANTAGAKRFIYASSSAVYGDRPESPKTEDLSPMPLSPYAAGKLAGEAFVSAFANSYGMQAVSLRYFNVFGPRQRPDSPYAAAVPIFLSKIREGNPITVYGDGEQTRDFTYIDNVVAANLLASQADGLCGQAVNIACGEEVSVNALIAELCSITSARPEIRNAPPRQGEVRYSVASIELARRLLGYNCAADWKEGLRITAEAFAATAPR